MKRHYSWLRWGGRLLGAFFDFISPSTRALEASTDSGWSEGQLQTLVASSPRANAYLSLEPGLQQRGTPDGILTWVGWGQTAFAVGGLHGPSAGSSYQEFRHAAQAAGYKRVLAFPVAEAERETLGEVGFRSLMVGSEAFIDPTTFSLAGGARADLRQMVNRGQRRHGLVVGEVAAPEMGAGLPELYEGWLASRPAGYPMRLLIGSPRFAEPQGRRYFQIQGPDGAPQAFVSITPGWSGQGYGLDVMARPPAAPSGAMETLLCGVIDRLAEEGVQRFSLGACPMSDEASPPVDDPALYRLLFRWLHRSRVGNRLFAFRSLTHFKAKFVPRWEPVFLAAWPAVGFRSLYDGCRMWGLFGTPPQVVEPVEGLPRDGLPR